MSILEKLKRIDQRFLAVEWNGRASFLRKIEHMVRLNVEIHMVLPGFPFKSINVRDKVFGTLPDEGEKRAIANLAKLCSEISAIYEPGARLSIVSDGSVFADVLNVPLETVRAYGEAVQRIGRPHGIEFLTLEDLLPGVDISDHVQHLLENYARPTAVLHSLVTENQELMQLYLGFTHFMQYELQRKGGQSGLAFRRECKQVALRMLQRSEAYSMLLAAKFPEALRLSIHPKGGDSEKFGINLISGQDGLGTPWHNVLVQKRDGSCELMHKRLALEMGFRLVIKDGRPSHFEEH